MARGEVAAAEADAVNDWAHCGAMMLTGVAERAPLGPPARMVAGLHRLAAAFRQHADRLGCDCAIDPFQLIVDRAAIAGLSRRGDVSCGGASHLMATQDGWIAVSLARESDVDLVPAWLECTDLSDDVWDDVPTLVSVLPGDEVVARARMLGLPAAVLGEVGLSGEDPITWGGVTDGESAGLQKEIAGALVVDLTSLWAGPLCTSILQGFGARVVKVESWQRPDGARRGEQAFFDLLNAGKESVAIDFTSDEELEQLQQLLARADVVVEGSRPRALEQLGITPEAMLAQSSGVWLSITGYGRALPQGNWAAFGDDAAVAGGLVAWDDGRPSFCADAVADPLTGMVGALAALKAMREPGPRLVEVAMAEVAAAFGGPTLDVGAEMEALAPEIRRAKGRAAELGQHTELVLAER